MISLFWICSSNWNEENFTEFGLQIYISVQLTTRFSLFVWSVFQISDRVYSNPVITLSVFYKIHTLNTQWQILILSYWSLDRAANRYGISVFCTEFTCKIREYEFGLQNTEIELCQFCHIKYCCQNKAYLFWVANQSRFVAFYALKPSNTSLITKTFNLLSSTCSSSTFSCLTSCSCSTERIH